MTLEPIALGAQDTDDDVDVQISACLDPAAPRSFFVYAGAGSGKTRSLKDALDRFRARHGDAYRRAGRRIAVITYTRAAAKEIAERVGEDPLFPISTIHSFCWTLIGSHHADIRTWLLAKLPVDHEELVARHAKGRGGQAHLDRERAMASIKKRIEYLSVPRTFTYNPNGDNFGADSLSHGEVLALAAAFITAKPAMQAVLINAFPFLLIDESQDTSKGLIAALFGLAETHKDRFALGLLGDTMQRIYGDGQVDLGKVIPPGWASPVKRMNHRSARRIVQLGNAIRAGADDQRQVARDDSEQGVVRFFAARADVDDKPAFERDLKARMAQICDDGGWIKDGRAVKTLTLEHHMAASRRGFAAMFKTLDSESTLSTGLRNGDLAGIRLFSERVAPLMASLAAGDRFAVMSHLRGTSPLLKTRALANPDDPDDPLGPPRQAIAALAKLDLADPKVTFFDVLKCVADHRLFDIPTSLAAFLDVEPIVLDEDDLEGGVTPEEEDAPPSSATALEAWRAFLDQSYQQIVPFAEYVADQGPYGTHQGVKGLEFDRVLVIMDDGEAKGFMFSYEKLFGTKPLSENDLKRAADGEETGADRTRRLLYVTSTRAKKSLALVAYSENPEALTKAVIDKGWFAPDEVEVVAA